MANTPSSEDFDALLDEFIKKQLADTEDTLAENYEASTKKSLYPVDSEDDDFSLASSFENINDEDADQTAQNEEDDDDDDEYEYEDDDLLSPSEDDIKAAHLQEEEKRLYSSYREFVRSSLKCAEEHQITKPAFYFSPDELMPRFRPSRTDNLKRDIASCWDILLTAEADKLTKLPFNASDEQILDFAEKISVPALQLALISYVETLIEIDACENAYNLRKVKYQKHKIEKQLYEEKQRITEKKRLYAHAIREHNFPVDADKLINNFFKTSAKDPVNASKILETNPATFAPIQTDKIPDRFFGLIKAGPEDGKIVNKKLGKFLTKLKV